MSDITINYHLKVKTYIKEIESKSPHKIAQADINKRWNALEDRKVSENKIQNSKRKTKA